MIANTDPQLGGNIYSAPGLAPYLAFTKACQNTPNGEVGCWIIPWDHSNRDFVYPAIDDDVYRGYMTGYDLKSVSIFNLTF